MHTSVFIKPLKVGTSPIHTIDELEVLVDNYIFTFSQNAFYTIRTHEHPFVPLLPFFSSLSFEGLKSRGKKFGLNLHKYMRSVLMGLILGQHPWGSPQAQEGVGKCSLEALTSRVLKLEM